MPNFPTINGNEYSWAQITVAMLGSSTPVEGITAIKYKTKMEKKNIYARGNRPVKRGTGNKEYEASITLLQSEVDAILALLPPGKDLTDVLPFDVTVIYMDDSGNMVYHKLKYCEFMEFEHGMKQGDTHAEIECPLIIGKIDYTAVAA